MLTVKANQPTLYASCRNLPWEKATAKYYDRSRGHGRTETRVVQVLTVSHFAFPHVKQVARITPHRTEAATSKRTRETGYVIIDLSFSRAKPRTSHRRWAGHWGIENKIPYVRDTLWDEDRSRVRTGHGPENMAPCATPLTSAPTASSTSPKPSETCPMNPSPGPATSSASPADQREHRRNPTLREPWAR
ncbi:ISAs1 family transposase [Streptomyces sp. NPDC007355]|uniref:ISAs1 family transposase n=1 Tax=Streptomyces sp. NPDC007355 TaxID=3364778 RepID=UPI0036A4A6CE